MRGEPWFALAYLPDPAKSNRWRLQMDFEVENGSVRSSFATTINVLEGLLAHER